VIRLADDEEFSDIFDEAVTDGESDPKKEEKKSKKEPKEEAVEPAPKEPEKKEEPKKEEPEVIEKPEKPKEKPKPKKKSEDGFDFSPTDQSPKINIIIYAQKGCGKTTLAFSVPGSHNCISFDRKSASIKVQAKDPDRITVYDGVRYIDKSSAEQYIESCHIDWRYINGLISTMKNTDWTVVDGGEIFHSIAEQVMRYNNGLMPFQGISNRNLWKERKLMVSQLFHRCLEKSNKGVIWTAYVDKEEIIEDGEFVAKKDVPKWIDAVLYETDIVIKIDAKKDNSGKIEYFATIESCKVPDNTLKKLVGGKLSTGKPVKITDTGFPALVVK